MRERRRLLGGSMPTREPKPIPFEGPAIEEFSESLAGSKGRGVSTTMGYVSMLRQLLKDPKIGKLIVPIIPDEGRTFGMESIIRQVGIYASQGQLYKPHDQDMLLYYREEKSGQILEEGITEAGSMASFTAAGTSYSNYDVITIPFFTYYSMFGFQRIGDMVWAFADARGKGFLMGGTAGRTTLSGEGLQHQDGHSIVLASTVPDLSRLRSGVRLRDRGDRAGRHSPHVRAERRPLLLHHAVQRRLSDAGDAAGLRRRHSARHLQVSRSGEGQGRGAVVRQWPDSE